MLANIDKRKRVKHHASMPYAQVPALIQQIGPNPNPSAKALLFGIITSTRTSETIEATWGEFDLENKLWIIPKARMKRSIEHRVPLSDQAVELLKSITKVDGSSWVFNGHSRKKSEQIKPLSNAAMSTYLKNTLGYKAFTVHGFRSSFRDWAGETTTHTREVIEHALAHGLANQTEAAYQRGDYLEKRRALMTDWSNYCFGSREALNPQPLAT